MKTMVVFYSMGGNTKLIAESIAKQLGAETLELLLKKPIPDKGFGKFFFGGKSVIFKDTPELANEKIDLSPYDSLVLATPVWAGSYASPLNTFVSQNPISGKKVALVACHAGGGADKCFAALKKALPGNQFVGQIDFVNPLKGNADTNAQAAANWAQGLSF